MKGLGFKGNFDLTILYLMEKLELLNESFESESWSEIVKNYCDYVLQNYKSKMLTIKEDSFSNISYSDD